MVKRHWLLSTTSIAALIVGVPGAALAADLSAPALNYDPYVPPSSLPAVSAINGKIGTFIGDVSNDFAFGVDGSLAIPLSERWGAQIDGMVGSAGSAAFYGVGGHVFWRDPSQGLIGAYGSYVGWGTTASVPVGAPIGAIADITGANVGKIGIEGERYLGRFSLEGLAAYQYGTNSGFAGRATVAYYPTDDLRLDLSLRYLQGIGGIGSAGVEWEPTQAKYSLFANAAVGGNGYWQVLGGARFYFANTQKSLIGRQREDDPENSLPLDLYKTTGAAHCPAGQQVLNINDGATCGVD
jgi:hypothetical protein